MSISLISFVSPVTGVDAEFNTFRLGEAYAKRLNPNDVVALINEKTKHLFGFAQVTKLVTGRLDELCAIHAYMNHTQLGEPATEAPAQVYKTLQRIYGPHIVKPDKKATVIYMRRLSNVNDDWIRLGTALREV